MLNMENFCWVKGFSFTILLLGKQRCITWFYHTPEHLREYIVVVILYLLNIFSVVLEILFGILLPNDLSILKFP